MRKGKLVDPRFAKSQQYQEILREIKESGCCPFCPTYRAWHNNPELRRLGEWFITRSIEPYPNAREHFLIIGDSHRGEFADLTAEDWRCIAALARWAIREFKLGGGSLCLRFGDTSYSGATVCHLHAHLIVPCFDETTGQSQPVNFPIG